ncbi:MAG: hypothetical protein DHS20C17_18640 [Cyclobacteriaceae bacterium]|nr:MAG: hypothetical protein DHS20C17_18640 [Cyclobacteriaceae bacterium]
MSQNLNFEFVAYYRYKRSKKKYDLFHLKEKVEHTKTPLNGPPNGKIKILPFQHKSKEKLQKGKVYRIITQNGPIGHLYISKFITKEMRGGRLLNYKGLFFAFFSKDYQEVELFVFPELGLDLQLFLDKCELGHLDKAMNLIRNKI